MRRDIIIGIDAGTSVIKSVGFMVSGEQLAVAALPNVYETVANRGVEQDILYCVVTRLEIGKVRAIVKDVDSGAFVIFHPLTGAEGGVVKTRGFH